MLRIDQVQIRAARLVTNDYRIYIKEQQHYNSVVPKLINDQGCKVLADRRKDNVQSYFTRL